MIYRRGNKWWIQYHANGRRLRESVERVTGKNTERAAKALEKKRLANSRPGRWSASMTSGSICPISDS